MEIWASYGPYYDYDQFMNTPTGAGFLLRPAQYRLPRNIRLRPLRSARLSVHDYARNLPRVAARDDLNALNRGRGAGRWPGLNDGAFCVWTAVGPQAFGT